jgi:hypothetical protein
MQLKGIALNSGLPLGALVTKSDADLGSGRKVQEAVKRRLEPKTLK